MLRYLKNCSRHRGAWLLLLLSALLLEAIALWFQYVKSLDPCVLCIYQRVAMAGMVLAGLTGLIAPQTFIRFIAILIWLVSAGKGALLSLEHSMILLHPSSFSTCDFVPQFPLWLPLHHWLPQVFSAGGNCSLSQWHWLGLEMPQWLLGIFIIYILLALMVLLAQFVRQKKPHVRLFR